MFKRSLTPFSTMTVQRSQESISVLRRKPSWAKSSVQEACQDKEKGFYTSQGSLGSNDLGKTKIVDLVAQTFP